jgi:hypothetical protein|tara:strand:+ start:1742 stop:1873 length:132 start_codon:yes stop_codon:yes gene_type:complete
MMMAELTVAQKRKLISALKKASKTHLAQAKVIEKSLVKTKRKK